MEQETEYKCPCCSRPLYKEVSEPRITVLYCPWAGECKSTKMNVGAAGDNTQDAFKKLEAIYFEELDEINDDE